MGGKGGGSILCTVKSAQGGLQSGGLCYIMIIGEDWDFAIFAGGSIMKRKTKVGLVTSGGDCQGLNAAIRGVGKSLFQYVDIVEI